MPEYNWDWFKELDLNQSQLISILYLSEICAIVSGHDDGKFVKTIRALRPEHLFTEEQWSSIWDQWEKTDTNKS